MTITQGEILQALFQVLADGLPLPETGRLSEIVVDSAGRVSFAIGIEPAEQTRFEPVRAAAEATVKALPGATGAFVALTGERAGAQVGGSGPPPLRRATLPGGTQPAGAGARAGARSAGPRRQDIEGIRHVVAVASGKGGVGKSTLACNLALALHLQGLAVGLMDADIYGPSAPRLFGLSGRKPRLISGRILEPISAFGIKVMSIGFLVEEDTAMIWRGPMVMSAITQMLREVAWGELDILVVDMPPGTGDAQLTMAQTVPLSGAVIVSTPQDLALLDARRGIAMFRKVEVPILGIVENMAGFACPHCGEISHIFGQGGARREGAALGVPFLGEVPLEMAIRETSDSGSPLVAAEPDSVHARAFREIAARVWERVTARSGARPPPRIVVE